MCYSVCELGCLHGLQCVCELRCLHDTCMSELRCLHGLQYV